MKKSMKQYFLGLILFASSSLFAKEYRPYDFYQFFGRKEVRDNIFPEDRLTYDEIKSWKVKSYKDFLKKLNQFKPSFYENEVMIHNSSSLQPGSLENPRVLLFGEGLVLSFSEQDSSKNTVELVEFDREEVRFIPHEIEFNSNEVKFKDNPTSCLSCHGEPFRPIWNPYDFWPRAFGSRIGRIGSGKEEDAYLSYFEKEHEGIGQYLQEDAEPEQDYLFLHSIEAFTGYMNTLNSLTMAKTIADKDLKSDKYALLWILNNCANPNELQGDEGFKAIFSKERWENASVPFTALKKDTFSARQWFKSYSDRIYNEAFPNIRREYFFIDHNRLIDEAYHVTRLRFILENHGLSLRSMTMAHGSNDYFFSTPNNFLMDLKDSYEYYSGETKNYSCEDLAQLSRESEVPVKGRHRMIQFNRTGKDLSPLGQCMKCHTMNYKEGKTRGPFIPFDDSQKMRKLLNSSKLGEEIKYRLTTEDEFDQMPPRGRLSEKEVKSLIEYIETLKNN